MKKQLQFKTYSMEQKKIQIIYSKVLNQIFLWMQQRLFNFQNNKRSHYQEKLNGFRRIVNLAVDDLCTV